MIIGLDVGGTHTDVVLIGEKGIANAIKVPTETSDLFGTILESLTRITQGIDPGTINRAVLSTTLTTNAIVQRKTAPVGMLVAGGPGIDPDYFRTGEHYYSVAGAMDHRGREIEPIDAEQIRQVGQRLKAAGIRLVGVVGKFSVRNPQHELAMGRLLEADFDRVFYGHRFSGQLNFPRRIATTYLNAAVAPIHQDFFEAVQKSLQRQGLGTPIRLLKPDGGNMRFAASLDCPAQTILSGPAASVMGAVASAAKDQQTLVLDIGGTTTDMAILIDGVPLLDPVGVELGGFKTLIRALRTHSIGVGGDSMVKVEADGLRVGPERIGLAMAYGGPVPTPTDAFHVLGLGEGGNCRRAREGIGEIAAALGMNLEAAAELIFETACRQILDGAAAMTARINREPVYTVHELYEDSRIAPRRMLILGGPAPQFAARLETLFDGPVQVVPRWKVANAIGAALARTTCEVALLADTQQRMATAPEENFFQEIRDGFNRRDAEQIALGLLRDKALRRGAKAEALEMELIESLEFNMVRGFHTAGKNIRVRAQVKPGLIEGYAALVGETCAVSSADILKTSADPSLGRH